MSASSRKRRVCIPVPIIGFDPTEVAVPWTILTASNIECVFATPEGSSGPVPQADPVMVTGQGLFLLKWSLRADANGQAAYQAVCDSGNMANRVAYSELRSDEFDGLLLPGGHCPEMRPYLEDATLQAFVRQFSATGKPVAAVCHGVVLAARSGILTGKQVTALPSWMEGIAHNLTRLWMGNYYKTYPGTSVEKEVTESCAEYLPGPKSLTRDSEGNLEAGFIVEDGSLLTARWPGDAHRFSHRFVEILTSSLQS